MKIVQSSCGCPVPAGVQGQVGQGLKQPGTVAGSGTEWALRFFQPKPFWDSTKKAVAGSVCFGGSTPTIPAGQGRKPREAAPLQAGPDLTGLRRNYQGEKLRGHLLTPPALTAV